MAGVSGGVSLDELRVRADVPSVVVVAGPSMEPGLPAGCRLRVVPCGGVPSVGDVVVLRSGAAAPSSELVVHRLVWIADIAGHGGVFHRGDAEGRLGVTSVEAVVGQVAAVLDPPGCAVPSLTDLVPEQWRGFNRAQRRCRAYVMLRRIAERCGLTRVRTLTAFARRLLLGA